ncbi:DNA repair protein RadA [Flavobacteriales bacterium]|jgi:DNA repair protein RadA/Sms|nr:DNA repair protein RadA [Flavobacteriales bacterium]MDA8934354.1 DNA repair protein RadA [Flavobacteriales bacterium]|tara:strand:- start:1457 stop:2821 length:1365 start_codon:yes stop_codon:yes gene_type:complete
MAKTKVKTAYFCQSCGSQHPKWQGQCSVCKEWNTVVEEVVQKEVVKVWSKNESKHKVKALKVADISIENEERIQTDNIELDRVLGGGIVPGAIILLGGEPGIGKSTLMLQLALSLRNCKTLYVSGEESDKQIKMRAERLGEGASDCYILTETATQNIFTHIKEVQPDLVVIDSIQTLHTQSIDSSPGSISQIRETAAELLRFAKETATPVILIGHITKDGNIAGPKILEHMVDVVLQFEGDRNHIYRILRAQKNRFGSTAEIGIYEMVSQGLREVHNPSEILISQKEEPLSGTAISATVEGMRPMLIEIQALVSSAVYGTPQRSATGFDLRRLNMLLAVLEKRCGFRLGAKDVFLNITGGIKVDDPSIDLAVVCAILSSNEDCAIPDKICLAGEVGLSGEIRPATRIEQRILEAEKLGFEQIFISQYNKVEKGKFAIKVMEFGTVEEVYQTLFN